MLRGFDERSRHFLLSDRFINSHNLISWQCMDIVRRKLMLVTIGTCQAFCSLFEKANMCLRINWILKLTAQFCFLRLYLGIETVSFCLLPWMARMDMDWNLKKFGQQFPVYIIVNAMPTKITKKNTFGLCSQMEFTLKIPHNYYTGAFCVWVKPLSSEFSTELT